MKKILSILVCISLCLSCCGITTLADSVVYDAPTNFYYNDFSENADCITDTSNVTPELKTDEAGNGYLNVVPTDNASLTLTTQGSTSAEYFAIEYRIKPITFAENANRALYCMDRGGADGFPCAGIYDGNLTTTGLTRIDGTTVTNGEWYTITNVFKNSYVAADGSEYVSGDKYLLRDTYLNGVLVDSRAVQSSAGLGIIDGNTLTMQLVFKTTGNFDFDFDYVKFYSLGNDFAAKLAETDNASTDEIEVLFNSIPKAAELLTLAEVVDEAGNNIAGIKSAEVNNKFNPGTDYAQSITLKLDTSLENGASYKLKFSGLSDFAGKTLSDELSFATKAVEYAAPTNFYYNDFSENADCITDTSNVAPELKTDEEGNGYLNVVPTDNASLTLTTQGSTSAEYFAIEYRIKPITFAENANRALYCMDRGGADGFPCAGIYDGNLTTTGLTRIDGTTVTNGEWYTITNVFKNGYVAADGSEYVSGDKYFMRDTYLNGVLVDSRAVQSSAGLGIIDGNTLTMQLVFKTTGNFDFDFDYVKFYSLGSGFSAKLAESENVSTDEIEVLFSSIPKAAELLTSAKVVDVAGNIVAGIKSAEVNNKFNPGTDYAQSVTLKLDTKLDFGTVYKLSFDGLTDFAGNAFGGSLSFATKAVSYDANGAYYYNDFSENTNGIGETVSITPERKTDENGNGYLSVVPAEDTSMSLLQIAASGEIGADYYVIEYKVNPVTYAENPNRALYCMGRGGTDGFPCAGIYNGKLTTATLETIENTSVTSGEWYTITNVFKNGYVAADGSEYVSGDRYLMRDTYLNGELVDSRAVQCSGGLAIINGDSTTMELVFRTTAVFDYDLDYVKFFTIEDDFAAKLATTENVATEEVEVWFNSIPKAADLLESAEVVDEAGNKVAGVKAVMGSNRFNPGTDYAQSLKLLLDTALENNSTYKLKMDGVQDIAGNIFSTAQTFVTGSLEIGNITVAEDSKTVSVEIANNTVKNETYTLIIAAYEENNGAIKMLGATQKTITVTPGTQVYTSNELEVSGANFIKGFLWSGMKPVASFGEKSF